MRAFILVLVLMLAFVPARAEPVTTEELQQALRERDHVIADLEKRIAALEKEHQTGNHAPVAQSSSAADTSAKPNDIGRKAEDDVALQALSRTLVARGALVLPTWSVELAPSFSYSHNQTEGLVLVPTSEGLATVASQRLRDDSLKAILTGRIGLPWNSEIEVRVPYAWTQESVSLGDGTHSVSTKSRIGDIDVELSHQIMREDGWKPDLLAAVSARFPTGADPYRSAIPNLASGFGTYEIGGRLTALKSADPMVFFGTLAYAHEFPVHEPLGRIQPGDTIRFDFGGILAVSPRTSLTADFVQQFVGRTQIDGKTIPGSDRVMSIVQLGADYVLSRQVLLDVSLGIGVTNDAPDYTFLFSVPVRF